MRRSTIAVLLIALIGTSLVHPICGQFAPAPGPARQTMVVPQTTQVVAPAPVITASGAVATAPVVQTITTPVTVPATAPTTSAQAPAASATARTPAQAPSTPVLPSPAAQGPSAAASTPSRAPAQAPTTPAAVAATTPGSSPRLAPAAAATAPATAPARGPSSGAATTATAPSAGTTSGAAANAVPGVFTTAPTPGIPGGRTIAVAPAPAVPPSESGNYNFTLRASNATGTLNTQQAQNVSSQVQRTLNSGGVSTNAALVNQALASGSSSSGRRLQQSTFALDLTFSIGPISPTQAKLCQQILNGLELNLGTIVVLVLVVIVPIPVYIPVPTVIPQPPSVPALPSTTVINVITVININNFGSNLPAQSGGTTNINNVVNNVNNVTNINNSQTNNIVNNNQITNINSGNSNTVNQIINQVINPATPGSASSPSPPSSSSPPATPGTTPAPAAPATPGGAVAGVAVTVAANLSYVTPASPVAPSPPPTPSPPPSPPPSCGSQPQCRIYTRDMLCCQNEGILTPFQGAQIEILCTHPVRFAITCLATSGPTNISAASVYNNDYGYNYNFRTNINWLGQTGGYLGKVGVDVQPARLDTSRPECSLNLQTPCTNPVDGSLVTTMPAVQPLTFNVIDFTSFYQSYVGFPPTNAIGQFSYSWMNSTYPGGCLEQPTLTVPGSFFLGAWPDQAGFAYPCNAAATFGALQQTCPNVGQQAQTGVAGIQPQA